MRQTIFLPKLATCLHDYTRAKFAQDLIAGVTVGVIALPLAIAFGIASIPEEVAREAGLSPPVMGLFTAVVAGFLISALGGTRVAIGGPTGAFVVIVYSIAATHGFAGLAVATMMAGVILILLGVTRLGGMVKYIPYPVTTGFTSGIAVVIAFGQVRDFLGLDMPSPPPGFLEKVREYAAHIGSVNPASLGISVACVALIVLWPRFVTRKVPGTIVAVVLATVAVQALGLNVETIEGRFGPIPSGLPTPRLPRFDWNAMPDLVGPAFTIAILAAIESLLCAVVADGMLGTRHRSNTELIAQGVANIASPLFAGIPATGAIARTAANVESGGRTPISGIVHAFTLLAIMVALGRFAGLIPLSALAAVLMVVAWRMSEFHRFRWLLSGPRSDAAVLVTTFLLTVLIDLTVAVQVGVVLAAMLFIKRMADVTNVSVIKGEMADASTDAPLNGGSRRKPIPGVEVYRIQGPFFFGAAYKLREVMDMVEPPPAALVLDLNDVPTLDATGMHALDEIRRMSKAEGTTVVLAGVHTQTLVALVRSGMDGRFGEENLRGSLEDALGRAAEIAQQKAAHGSGGPHAAAAATAPERGPAPEPEPARPRR